MLSEIQGHKVVTFKMSIIRCAKPMSPQVKIHLIMLNKKKYMEV